MLTKIVAAKREEVACQKQELPLAKLQEQVYPGKFAISQALQGRNWSLIAECKLASPVKGPLSSRTVPELAVLYEQSGAAVLSILTDRHFQGSLTHIAEAKAVSKLPVLRKDFIIDEYQLYQARAAGADGTLLIAAILSDEELSHLLQVAKTLGLDCLVEVHSKEELERVQKTEARLIGINNRDLRTFQTSIERTFELLPYCDSGRLLISESGIVSGDDARRLQAAGVRGALVGEGLVKAAHISLAVRQLSLSTNGENR